MVVDAVRAGSLVPGVAAMFYTCRVLGYSIAAVAPMVGRDPGTVSRWIARSVCLLKAGPSFNTFGNASSTSL